MIRLLSGTDSWALAQICVDRIQIAKDPYLAAIIEPAAGGLTPTRLSKRLIRV